MAIVLGQLDAAWPLANFDGPDGFHLVGVYHANGVALLVRNIGGKSVRLSSKADNDCKSEQTRALFAHWYAQTGFHCGQIYCKLHCVSGRSWPSVSSAENWCR